MAEDQIQKHLDKGRFGTPQINPDEQRKYLGTFRERCYLSMTIGQMKDKDNQQKLLTDLKNNPGSQILLNGQISESLQGAYIQLITKTQHPFTVVNDFSGEDPGDIGLLVVAKEAVNQPVIDVDEKYPDQKEPEEVEKKDKPGFFDRLFHHD